MRLFRLAIIAALCLLPAVPGQARPLRAAKAAPSAELVRIDSYVAQAIPQTPPADDNAIWRIDDSLSEPGEDEGADARLRVKVRPNRVMGRASVPF